MHYKYFETVSVVVSDNVLNENVEFELPDIDEFSGHYKKLKERIKVCK